jgi:miniconductance mechanosensitive channel
MIDGSQTLIVRHREPTGNGLPLQVYGYVKINQFVTYENIQAEVFEHLFAIMNEFGLRIFQQPTGEDMLTLSGKN